MDTDQHSTFADTPLAQKKPSQKRSETQQPPLLGLSQLSQRDSDSLGSDLGDKFNLSYEDAASSESSESGGQSPNWGVDAADKVMPPQIARKQSGLVRACTFGQGGSRKGSFDGKQDQQQRSPRSESLESSKESLRVKNEAESNSKNQQQSNQQQAIPHLRDLDSHNSFLECINMSVGVAPFDTSYGYDSGEIKSQNTQKDKEDHQEEHKGTLQRLEIGDDDQPQGAQCSKFASNKAVKTISSQAKRSRKPAQEKETLSKQSKKAFASVRSASRISEKFNFQSMGGSNSSPTNRRTQFRSIKKDTATLMPRVLRQSSQQMSLFRPRHEASQSFADEESKPHLRRKVYELETRLKRMGKENAKLTSELKATQTKNEKLKNRIYTIKDDLDDCKREIDRLRQSKRRLEEDLASSKESFQVTKKILKNSLAVKLSYESIIHKALAATESRPTIKKLIRQSKKNKAAEDKLIQKMLNQGSNTEARNENLSLVNQKPLKNSDFPITDLKVDSNPIALRPVVQRKKRTSSQGLLVQSTPLASSAQISVKMPYSYKRAGTGVAKLAGSRERATPQKCAAARSINFSNRKKAAIDPLQLASEKVSELSEHCSDSQSYE